MSAVELLEKLKLPKEAIKFKREKFKSSIKIKPSAKTETLKIWHQSS